MKIFTNVVTKEVRIVGRYGSTVRFKTREEALADYRRLERNAFNRERNQVLRDITGTSARAARLDMGLI